MKKIIIDVFGADDPALLIRGAAEASEKIDEVTLVLCGDREYIENSLSGCACGRIEILEASEVITNDDDPTKAVMQKRDSSMVVTMRTLKSDPDCIGAITAGSTGAALLSSAAFLGRQKGIAFPALATFLPRRHGGMSVLLDCGANVDARPEQMRQFALMGTALCRSCAGIENPGVAVVSVGTEDKKGNAFSKEVFRILSETDGINFLGNMEARDAFSGKYDVMVCDGFTGNVLLKATEGSALFVMEKTVMALKKNLPDGVDAGFIKTAVGEVMEQIDFSTIAGAMILGVEKPVIKAHGNSNNRTIYNTVRQLLDISAGGYIEQTEKMLKDI